LPALGESRRALRNAHGIMAGVPIHLHLASRLAKLGAGFRPLGRYLDCLGPRLLHVHLSENDGTADQH
jgi:hypothetical protein